ncbi:deoxyribose-phosphate aldolase [Candidatus Woesearchaeota archaeon]|nr:deoxyribose-phosphate aldolase [Candidatus Woesearchaeota archaeon]
MGIIEDYILTRESLASIIDHTLLKQDATEDQIRGLCKEAKKYGFGAVCINQGYIKIAKQELKNSKVKICTVVGFPLGASVAKAEETKKSINLGASEIDMVINVGYLKSGKYKQVKDDIKNVVGAAQNKVVKVIIETCLLTKNQIITACELSKEAGADYVKTSTGFSSEGATIKNVTLMREIVGDEIGVKAAGGIKDLETALGMIKAGTEGKKELLRLFRIGTSSGVKIIGELKK